MPEVKIEFDAEGILNAIDEGARVGLNQAAGEVVDEAKKRAPHRIGTLRESINHLPPEGSYLQDTLSVTVGAGAPHAAWIEYGTGLHGPLHKTYPIDPVNGDWLRWPDPMGDGFIFAQHVDHPGMRAQPFLTPAINENLERITELVGDGIELWIERLPK
jgi:HK97 gp10 family phage protein